MNDKGVEALVSAVLSGRKQIRGSLADDGDGRCAMGVLLEAQGLPLTESLIPRAVVIAYDLQGPCGWLPSRDWVFQCPECFTKVTNEVHVITHLNDDHGWDFLTIARKLGPDGSGAQS